MYYHRQLLEARDSLGAEEATAESSFLDTHHANLAPYALCPGGGDLVWYSSLWSATPCFPDTHSVFYSKCALLYSTYPVMARTLVAFTAVLSETKTEPDMQPNLTYYPKNKEMVVGGTDTL